MKAAAASLLSLICLLATLPSVAQVYTYKDADGNTVFTDQPRPGARRVELAPTNRVSSPAAPSHRSARSSTTAVPAIVTHYDMLRILTPLPDAGVQQDDGALIVTVSSDPALVEGNYYRLLMDETPVGDPGRGPVFSIQNVDRGEHKLAAEIIDDRGHVLERTPNQSFFMQRVSLSQKRRMHPCKTEDYGVRPECPLADKPADS